MTPEQTKEFADNLTERLLPILMPDAVDIVKLYNPANAASLTAEQIHAMQSLTSEQIKILAKAYPNSSASRTYLLIIDSRIPADKQVPSGHTFENLWNLRERNGQRWWVPFNFIANYKPRIISTAKPRRSEVLDLSDKELMTLPGFKTAQNGTVKATEEMVQVSKVKKEVVKPKEVVVTDLTAEKPKSNFTINTKPKSETISNPTIKPINP